MLGACMVQQCWAAGLASGGRPREWAVAGERLREWAVAMECRSLLDEGLICSIHWHRCGADIMMKEPSSLSTVQQHWMPKEDGGLLITADPEYKYFQQGLVAPLHVVSAVDASTSALR